MMMMTKTGKETTMRTQRRLPRLLIRSEITKKENLCSGMKLIVEKHRLRDRHPPHVSHPTVKSFKNSQIKRQESVPDAPTHGLETGRCLVRKKLTFDSLLLQAIVNKKSVKKADQLIYFLRESQGSQTNSTQSIIITTCSLHQADHLSDPNPFRESLVLFRDPNSNNSNRL